MTQIVAMDSTNEDALRAVDITSFDTVVVAIGSHFESNLMTTVALKSLGCTTGSL
jgi:trk system potassium uptake protein TrkA